jgi:hypothetical protein
MVGNLDLRALRMNFVCEPLPDDGGYTWTLATILSRLIEMAEERYGRRDPSWTPVGIEFSDDGPQTWYPGNRRHVAIQLSRSALEQPDRAIWQLAQEVPHLLSPTGRHNTATLFEEGICGVFARSIADLWHLTAWRGKPQGTRHGEAADLVQPLLEAHPDLVRRLRETQPCISAIDPKLIASICPTLSRREARRLCQPFR